MSGTNHIKILSTSTPEPIVGSLLITYNKTGDTGNAYEVIINSIGRNINFRPIYLLDSTYLYNGDVVNVAVEKGTASYCDYTVYRKDYTTDATNNDLGITNTFIISGHSTGNTTNIIFTATTLNIDYNFEYIVNIEMSTAIIPTPTPTPTLTPTPTPTITPTSTPSSVLVEWVYYYTGASTNNITIQNITSNWDRFDSTYTLIQAENVLLTSDTGMVSGSTTVTYWNFPGTYNFYNYTPFHLKVCQTGSVSKNVNYPSFMKFYTYDQSGAGGYQWVNSDGVSLNPDCSGIGTQNFARPTSGYDTVYNNGKVRLEFYNVFS